jgi:hypothetical protein
MVFPTHILQIIIYILVFSQTFKSLNFNFLEKKLKSYTDLGKIPMAYSNCLSWELVQAGEFMDQVP